MSTPPLIFNHPEDGFIRVGIETADRVDRKSSVQVGGGSGASLRIFEDGGWEIRAVGNEKGSNIFQQGEGPLNIYSDGDINVACKGEFSVRAAKITMQTTDADEGNFVVNARKNIRLDADNNFHALATNVVFKADNKLLSHSAGMNIMTGNPVIVFEKKMKIIPTGVADIVELLLGQLLLN